LKSKLFIILVIVQQLSFAQDSLSTSENSFFSRRNISIIALSGAYASTLISGYYMWWRDDYKPFTFCNPPKGEGWLNDPYTRGIDKAGHFYTSYFFYWLSRRLLVWGGYSVNSSKNVSALLSFGLGFLVEVGDGFSRYGFDYQDLTFNTLGLSYAYLQDQVPFFQNFNFKWSYIPTHNSHFPPNLTSTYEAHIYWLTVDVHNLFKSSVGKFWPSFLQLGVGYSISDNHQKREYVIGLDFNLLNIFHTENKDWNLIINTANMIHYPAPGVKFSPGLKPSYKLFMLN
jgi:hypothetical protein